LNPSSRSPQPEGCAACELASDRRLFIQRLSLVVGATLLGLGIPRRAAAAIRPGFVRGLAIGNTVSYPIPAADGVQIDRTNEVILTRWAGMVYAFNLACPHQRTALRWISADNRFECPKHHSKYQPDGTYISGRATRAMDRLGIRREGGNVVVDLDVMYKDDQDPRDWSGAQVAV
jgi:nitrite reductase/ring-hydroxylating ferredoxin subunit